MTGLNKLCITILVLVVGAVVFMQAGIVGEAVMGVVVLLFLASKVGNRNQRGSDVSAERVRQNELADKYGYGYDYNKD